MERPVERGVKNMIAIRCKSCNSNDIELRKGMAICRSCGTRYILEKKDRAGDERTIRIVIPAGLTDGIERKKVRISSVTKRRLVLLALSFAALLLTSRITSKKENAAESRTLPARTDIECESTGNLVKCESDPVSMIGVSGCKSESDPVSTIGVSDCNSETGEYDRPNEERAAEDAGDRVQYSTMEDIMAHDREVWEKDRRAREKEIFQAEKDEAYEMSEQLWDFFTSPSPYRERDNAAVEAQMEQAEEERLKWIEEHRTEQESRQAEQTEPQSAADAQAGSGSPVRPVVNGSGFGEIRVGEQYLGNTYFQTENRGSRMEGFDEFYYVNEH